jgi:hypothetical protein
MRDLFLEQLRPMVSADADVRGNPNFTVVDEYVGQATSAVHVLSSDAAVDNRKVFLAGHSKAELSRHGSRQPSPPCRG